MQYKIKNYSQTKCKVLFHYTSIWLSQIYRKITYNCEIVYIRITWVHPINCFQISISNEKEACLIIRIYHFYEKKKELWKTITFIKIGFTRKNSSPKQIRNLYINCSSSEYTMYYKYSSSIKKGIQWSLNILSYQIKHNAWTKYHKRKSFSIKTTSLS